MTWRILYLGPQLAGVRTTVSALGRLATPPFEPLRSGEGPWAMHLPLKSGAVELTVRMDPRANRFFPNALASVHAGKNYVDYVEYLKVVDGVVFVADSTPERQEANVERLEVLDYDLPSLGRVSSLVPVVFQCNKQDRPTALSADLMANRLRWPWCSHVGSVATSRDGVLDALDALVDMLESGRS